MIDKEFWKSFTPNHREAILSHINNLTDEEFAKYMFINNCPSDFGIKFPPSEIDKEVCTGDFDDSGCKKCWQKAFEVLLGGNE